MNTSRRNFLKGAALTGAAAFAGGFLPVHGGKPSVRSRSITDAGDVVASRKTYPTFAGGRDESNRLGDLRGTAYKMYFLPQDETAVSYTVGDMLYVYLLADGEARIATERTAVPVESSALSCRFETGGLTVRGERGGYAAFELY